jgi:hypothetical protein
VYGIKPNHSNFMAGFPGRVSPGRVSLAAHTNY